MDLGTVVVALAALTAGLAGGVYAAFSTMVMPTLRRRPDVEALATMQQINVAAVRPPFMIIFFGAVLGALAVIVVELLGPTGTSWLRVVGALCSVGGFLITIMVNVPRNNRIAALSSEDPSATTDWRRLAREWTLANHLRCAVSALAVVLLVLG